MTPSTIASFALGPIASAFVALLTLPIITWLFAAEDVGRLAMLQLAISFSALLFSLGLDQAYVREFHEADNKPALLKCAALPGLSVLSMVLLVLLSSGGTLASWLFGRPDWHLSLLIAMVLLASLISRFLSLVLRMNEQGLAYSMSQLLPKLVPLLIIGGYFITDADKNLTNLVLASSAGFLLVCGVFAFNTRSEWIAAITAAIEWHQLKKMLNFGLPLLVGGGAYWGLTASDKIFLRALTSLEELAVYSVAVSFAGAATVLQGVFSTVWAPIVYKWASKGEGVDQAYKVSRYILGLVVLVFCLAGLLSWLVALVLPPHYIAVQWILVACLGAPLLYTLSEATGVGIGITRGSSFAMLAALLALATNLLGNWLLVPLYGAAGAAVSTCVSFWVLFVFRTEFAIYLWKPAPRLQLYGFSALAVAGASIHTLLGVDGGMWMRPLWAILLLVTFLSFKSELREAWEYIATRLTS